MKKRQQVESCFDALFIVKIKGGNKVEKIINWQNDGVICHDADGCFCCCLFIE